MHMSKHPVAGVDYLRTFQEFEACFGDEPASSVPTFRLNRRRSNARGMLFHRLAQQAVALGPAPYRQIVATNQPAPALEVTCVKGIPTLRRAPQRLATLRTPEGQPIPPHTLTELQRDMARLRFVSDQIKEIEKTRLQELQSTPERRPHAMVQLVARIRGVGIETADMLVNEVLLRNLRDRKAVARYAGLTGCHVRFQGLRMRNPTQAFSPRLPLRMLACAVEGGH